MAPHGVEPAETSRVYKDLHAPIFEHHIFGIGLVRVVNDVRESRAARLTHGEPQTDTMPARGQERLDASCSGFSQ